MSDKGAHVTDEAPPPSRDFLDRDFSPLPSAIAPRELDRRERFLIRFATVEAKVIAFVVVGALLGWLCEWVTYR